jgi:fumarate reductase flavoprotein subunit
MSQKAGLIREGTGLTEALEQILSLKNRYRKLGVRNSSRIYNYELTSYLELGSMLNLAELVVEAARTRTESRGAHRRSDFPARDEENWRVHTVVSLRDGAPRWEKKPAASSR